MPTFFVVSIECATFLCIAQNGHKNRAKEYNFFYHRLRLQKPKILVQKIISFSVDLIFLAPKFDFQ